MSRYLNSLTLGFILAVGSPVFARTPSAGNADSTLRITVRIYNYGGIPRRDLTQAQKEATRILRQIGVETDWLDCRLSQNDPVKDSGCEERTGPTDLFLRILPWEMAKHYALGPNVFGFSTPTEDGEFGTDAGIFLHRVGELAAMGTCRSSVILGHLAAHEIGHLLLGPQSHSRTGIMRAPWRRTDLKRAARGRLLFTPQQAKRIRADVLARIGQQETLHLARLAVPE